MSHMLSLVRWTARFLFALTSVAVAIYAFGALYRSNAVGNPLAAKFAISGWDVPLHMFFALLALLWPVFTLRGVVLAVAGDTAGHRRWMCRSVALTFAAVTLRVGLGVGAGVLHLPFLSVYTTTAWASWLLNLAVCELILRWPSWRRALAAGGSRWASRPTGA